MNKSDLEILIRNLQARIGYFDDEIFIDSVSAINGLIDENLKMKEYEGWRKIRGRKLKANLDSLLVVMNDKNRGDRFFISKKMIKHIIDHNLPEEAWINMKIPSLYEEDNE
jgi:hypothetical protein